MAIFDILKNIVKIAVTKSPVIKTVTSTFNFVKNTVKKVVNTVTKQQSILRAIPTQKYSASVQKAVDTVKISERIAREKQQEFAKRYNETIAKTKTSTKRRLADITKEAERQALDARNLVKIEAKQQNRITDFIFLDAISPVKKVIGETVKIVVDATALLARDALFETKELVGKIFQKVVEVKDATALRISDLAENMSARFADVKEGIKGTVSAIGQQVKDTFGDVQTLFSDGLTGLLEGIGAINKWVGEQLRQTLIDLPLSIAVKFFEQLVTLLQRPASEVFK